jgi:hypothetical protein
MVSNGLSQFVANVDSYQIRGFGYQLSVRIHFADADFGILMNIEKQMCVQCLPGLTTRDLKGANDISQAPNFSLYAFLCWKKGSDELLSQQ